MVEKEGQVLSVSKVREEFPFASGSPPAGLGALRERHPPMGDGPGRIFRGQRSPRAPSPPLGRSHHRNALEGWGEEVPEFRGDPSLGLEPSCASLARALSYPITACRSEGATLPLSSSVLRRALWISLTPSQAVLLTPEEDREGSPDCGVENRGPEWPWSVDFSPDGQDEQWRLTPGPALCPLWLRTERCGEITCKPHGECDGPRAQ